MARSHYVFSSESVTAAHPDKLCDRISDEIVDRLLAEDPAARVVAECALFGGVMFLATRINSSARIDLVETARGVARQAGYRREAFDAEACSIMSSHLGMLPEQAPALDVTELDTQALASLPAGNQATLFGFATAQTPSMMPLPILLAHALAARLEVVARQGELAYLLPDGKSQVAIVYEDRRPVRLHSVGLAASQYAERAVEQGRLHDELMQAVIEPVLAEYALQVDAQTAYYLNPEGPFLGGGPKVHCGLTGRKTAVDNYGDYARHNGSALSGKDPLRIDRVGAYIARYLAKQVVAAGLARDCEIQVTYTVGQARPISLQVETFNTGSLADEEIARRLAAGFDLSPAGIVRALDLQHIAGRAGGFYRHLAAYGHMGRLDLQAPWERLDGVDALGN